MDLGIYGSSDDNFSSIMAAAKEEAPESTTKDTSEASSPHTALPLTHTTGKRSRIEDDDSSGSELDEVEGTSNDGEEETEEVVPAWMRYLPKTNFVPSSSSITTIDTFKEEADTHKPISKQPPSSNRFGPTSLTAKSQKRPRITPHNSSSTTSIPIVPSSHQRIHDKLKRTNVTEAAMLFSMSSGLGANK